MSTIVLFVEGETESALKGHLKSFLDLRAAAAGRPRVRLDTRQSVVNESAERLRHRVQRELGDPKVVAVVALIDAYPRFSGQDDPAAAAKRYLREVVGNTERFYAHVAVHDVEAWLLPFWPDICQELHVKQARPGGKPEEVDGDHPPSRHLRDLYRHAGRRYVKTVEMNRVLNGKDLTTIAAQCPEFKAFLNTLLTLAKLDPL